MARSSKDDGPDPRDSEKKPAKRRGRKRDESEDPKPERRAGPNPIAIIAGVAVVVVIIALIFMAFFNEGNIEDVYLGNPTEYYGDGIYPEGIYFPIYANSDSYSSADGEATVSVTYEGNEEGNTLYEKDVEIENDRGSVEIPFREFVIANGNYTFRIESGSSSDEKIYRVRDVVEKLEMKWSDNRSESSSFDDIHEVTFEITPLDSNGNRLMAYPSPFLFQGVLIKPDGSQRSIQSSSISNFSSIRITVDHETKGDYKLTGSWMNKICLDSSPYRSVDITQNTDYTVDARPASHAGEAQTVSLEGGEATVEFDGSSSWDDGEIVQYIWNFGDGTNETAPGPVTSHTYTEEGDYMVELIVVDDSGKRSPTSPKSITYVSVD